MYIDMYMYSTVLGLVLELVTSPIPSQALGHIPRCKNESAPIVAASDARNVKSDQNLQSL